MLKIYQKFSHPHRGSQKCKICRVVGNICKEICAPEVTALTHLSFLNIFIQDSPVKNEPNVVVVGKSTHFLGNATHLKPLLIKQNVCTFSLEQPQNAGETP